MNDFEESIEDGGQVYRPIFWLASILHNNVLKLTTGEEQKMKKFKIKTNGMSHKNYIKKEYDFTCYYECRIKVSYLVNSQTSYLLR